MTMSSEQPKHTDDLFLITREELDRCCSQMSAAGYKVSANYVEASVLSRPHPAPAPQQHTECYIDGYKDGERKAREDVLKEVRIKLSKLKTAYPTGADFVWWLVIDVALNELRSTTPHTEQEQP